MGCRRWFIRSNQKPLHTHTHNLFIPSNFWTFVEGSNSEVSSKHLSKLWVMGNMCQNLEPYRTPNQITIAYNRKKVNHIGHSRRQHSSWKRTVRSRLDSPSTLERKLQYNFWQGFQHVKSHLKRDYNNLDNMGYWCKGPRVNTISIKKPAK